MRDESPVRMVTLKACACKSFQKKGKHQNQRCTLSSTIKELFRKRVERAGVEKFIRNFPGW